jgi:hypothetical protein
MSGSENIIDERASLEEIFANIQKDAKKQDCDECGLIRSFPS